MCLFTTLVTLPVLYFLKPSLFSWKKLLLTAGFGILFTALLCGSKLYAVAVYMQNFPRDVHDQYFVDWYTSIGGAILQLIGVMSTLPFLRLIGKSSLVLVVRLTNWTGSPYGFWELDSSLSPALIVLLIYGIWTILTHKPRLDKSRLLKKCIAGFCLIFAVLLVFQFSTARGFLFDMIKGLPLLKSIRTNTRFVASFILPLAILGAGIFDYWAQGKSDKKLVSFYALINIISLVSLWAYYLLPMKVQGRNFEIQSILGTYAQIQAGDTFPVTKIIPEMNDYEVFEAQASNVTHHYDPLLGENSFLPLVRAGSVFDLENGFYNMTDPTGYVFPSENNSHLFSLIPASDSKKLMDFVNRRQPDWTLPPIQIALDWAAGLTFILIFLVAGIFLIKKWFPGLKLLHIHPFSRGKSS
jgi:hypothetical protein